MNSLIWTEIFRLLWLCELEAPIIVVLLIRWSRDHSIHTYIELKNLFFSWWGGHVVHVPL